MKRTIGLDNINLSKKEFEDLLLLCHQAFVANLSYLYFELHVKIEAIMQDLKKNFTWLGCQDLVESIIDICEDEAKLAHECMINGKRSSAIKIFTRNTNSIPISTHRQKTMEEYVENLPRASRFSLHESKSNAVYLS